MGEVFICERWKSGSKTGQLRSADGGGKRGKKADWREADKVGGWWGDKTKERYM